MPINFENNLLFFPVHNYRPFTALCLILILQDERWRQNVMEVKAYIGMFVSSHAGSCGSIQSSLEHSALEIQS